MSRFLSLLCAFAVLAGAVAMTRHGGDSVSFVELGAAPPHGDAPLPA